MNGGLGGLSHYNGVNVEKAYFTWRREEGADDGHVDGAFAVDVDVNLVYSDSSRRSNDGPTANWQ